MPILSCNSLSFSYDGKVVLKDVNFSIEERDYLSIVGENGAGKSTLIKGLLSLKKPTTGIIKFNEGLLKNEIGYLPQQSEIKQDFPASVFEIVLSGTLNKMGHKAFYTKKERDIANKNISILSIENLKNRCFRELSGGQKQRVLLARALCATSKILVLDEPTVGLDCNAKNTFYKLIKEINKKYNITIIMIIHDIKKAINESTKILHINKKQLFFGTPEEYIKSNVGKDFLQKEDVLV